MGNGYPILIYKRKKIKNFTKEKNNEDYGKFI